jgi:hypothetical protein
MLPLSLILLACSWLWGREDTGTFSNLAIGAQRPTLIATDMTTLAFDASLPGFGVGAADPRSSGVGSFCATCIRRTCRGAGLSRHVFAVVEER